MAKEAYTNGSDGSLDGPDAGSLEASNSILDTVTGDS